MNRLMRHRPSPAMVVACIALRRRARRDERGRRHRARAELRRHGRSSRPNAVTAAKIKNANVTGAKVARNAITGAKVLNRSLTAADFVGGSSLPKARQARRPRRARWPAGPAGTIGPITVRQAGVVVPGGVAQNGAYDTETVTVNCNAGEKAISAGTGWSDDAADRELWTQRITPIVTNNAVTGYRGHRRERQRQLEHVHALRPLLHGVAR